MAVIPLLQREIPQLQMGCWLVEDPGDGRRELVAVVATQRLRGLRYRHSWRLDSTPWVERKLPDATARKWLRWPLEGSPVAQLSERRHFSELCEKVLSLTGLPQSKCN